MNKTLKELHPADSADIIENLVVENRSKLIELVGFNLDPEIFIELNESIQTEVFILLSTESIANILKRLESDNALKIIKNLDDPETTKLMDGDAYATVINAKEISGDIKPGMSESEKKRVLHETTVIREKKEGTAPNLTCPNCNSPIRPTSKICGKCGKPINENEVDT